MKRSIFITCLVAALIVAVPVKKVPAEESATEAAKETAQAWLALVDTGKYAESWQEAAQIFKERVTREQWENVIKSVRSPLGKLETRTVKSADYTKTLPGTPDGEYVVIQYDTTFEMKKSAVETVTPMKDKDGHWRVAGYFIR